MGDMEEAPGFGLAQATAIIWGGKEQMEDLSFLSLQLFQITN